MEKPGQHIAIIVAVIGVIGTLGGALIQNWDKLFGRRPVATEATQPPQTGAAREPAQVAAPSSTTAAATTAAKPRTPAAEVAAVAESLPEPPALGGVWRELYPNPGTMTYTTQSGGGFRFTRQGSMQGLPFQAQGSGTFHGTRFESSYQSTLPSTGVCEGTLSDGGRRTTSVCYDSVYGQFETASERQ